MRPIDETLDECMEALNNADNDDQRLSVLIFVYAKGIGAAMRAKGHWPDPDAEEHP